MRIARIDHFVLTVASIEATCDFYARALGMGVVETAGNRAALAFGRQKIDLHRAGHELEPHARTPTPGSADSRLISEGPLDEVVAHLRGEGVEIEEGPVERAGATGPIRSVYLRDPDLNLVEVCECV